MSAPSPCVPCCSTPVVTNVPGVEGAAGADGDPGVNAFSILQTGFVAAGAGTSQTLTVDNSSWMVVGQIIVVDGPVHLKVTAVPSTTQVTATEQGYSGDVVGAIAALAKISPAGVGNVAILTGQATLVAGTVTITAAITANSVIVATWSDPDAATVGVLSIPTATRNVGAGTFVVNSVKADGTTPLNTDTGSFDWVVIG